MSPLRGHPHMHIPRVFTRLPCQPVWDMAWGHFRKGMAGIGSAGHWAKTPHSHPRTGPPAPASLDRQTKGHTAVGSRLPRGAASNTKLYRFLGSAVGKGATPPQRVGMGRAVLPPRGTARSLHPDTAGTGTKHPQKPQ